MLLDLIFYASWLLLLLGIFILSRELISLKWKNEDFAVFGAFLVTMIILFEAVLIKEEYTWKDDTLSNQFQRWLFGKPASDHWKWHVNPVTVPFSLVGRIVVLVASVFGESLGTFVSKFLSSLPWATSLLMVPFSFLCISLGILCIFGYQFNIGYGFLKVENEGKSKWKSIIGRIDKRKEKSIIDNDKRVVSKLDYCVKRVNEGYQRAICAFEK